MRYLVCTLRGSERKKGLGEGKKRIGPVRKALRGGKNEKNGGADSSPGERRGCHAWWPPLMGDDNKTTRYVIISCLPNRFEPKTTASATSEKSFPSTERTINWWQQNWSHQWLPKRAAGSGSPVMIRDLSTHLPNTNPVKIPGSTPSFSDYEDLGVVAKLNLH